MTTDMSKAFIGVHAGLALHQGLVDTISELQKMLQECKPAFQRVCAPDQARSQLKGVRDFARAQAEYSSRVHQIWDDIAKGAEYLIEEAAETTPKAAAEEDDQVHIAGLSLNSRRQSVAAVIVTPAANKNVSHQPAEVSEESAQTEPAEDKIPRKTTSVTSMKGMQLPTVTGPVKLKSTKPPHANLCTACDCVNFAKSAFNVKCTNCFHPHADKE